MAEAIQLIISTILILLPKKKPMPAQMAQTAPLVQGQTPWNEPGYGLDFKDSALDQPEVFAGITLSMNWSGQNRRNSLHSSRLSYPWLDLNRDWQADPQIYRRASLFELGVTASGDEYMMLAGGGCCRLS